jgi:hypothetical protein
MFLPDEKPTPRSGHPEFVFGSPAPSSRSEPCHPRQVRRTPCRSAARAPHEQFADVTPISLRRLRPLQRLVRRRSDQSSSSGSYWISVRASNK